MLSKPEYGWTDFQLEGTSRYVLSYTDDIAFDWLDKAIEGLETLKPFCVKGFMEPNRFLCLVSYWNCHIITEDDSSRVLEDGEIEMEYSHTSMLDFCRYLYEDISRNIDPWTCFCSQAPNSRYAYQSKRALLKKKLNTLNRLIAQREARFGPSGSFL